MKLSGEMIEVRDKLLKLGYEVILPRHTEEYAKMNTSDHVHNESVKNKVDHDLIRYYYRKIEEGDAILVVNCFLNGIHGYIGGNSFLEMGFAHVLNKPIYLLHGIPNMIYRDEIEAMEPIILINNILVNI